MKYQRSDQLHGDLVDLYKKGEVFVYGSLVYEHPDAEGWRKDAHERLEAGFAGDMAMNSLGFDYGYASFLDVLIGKKRCQVKNQPMPYQCCLFALFCSYKNIYVLGEHQYYNEDGFVLPSFHTVDNFSNKEVSRLAQEVDSLLEGGDYERVMASDLSTALTGSINLESNLLAETPLLFDGYFNWTD